MVFERSKLVKSQHVISFLLWSIGRITAKRQNYHFIETLRRFIMMVDKYMHTISVGVLKFNFVRKCG